MCVLDDEPNKRYSCRVHRLDICVDFQQHYRHFAFRTLSYALVLQTTLCRTQFLGMNTTAAYLGDSVLGKRQLYKIVDNVFEAVSVDSEDYGEDISHRQAVRKLVEDPVIQWVVSKKKVDPVLMNHSNNNDDDSECEGIGDDVDESTKFHHHGLHCGSLSAGSYVPSCKRQTKKLRFMVDYNTGHAQQDDFMEDEDASEVSSVILSPIARVNRESDSFQNSNSSMSSGHSS